MRLDAPLLALMKLVEGERFADVEMAARAILRQRPGNALALKALGFSLVGQKRHEEVLPLLDHAIARCPNDPELYNNRGIALSGVMRWDESIRDFRRALELEPDDPEVFKNLGVAFKKMHRWNDAIPPLLRAIECHPDDFPEAVEALADVLIFLRRVDEAWVCLNELWQSEKKPRFLYSLIYAQLHRCDWDSLDHNLRDLRDLSDEYRTALDNPFMALSCPGVTASEQKRIAATHADYCVPSAVFSSSISPALRNKSPGEPLRVAYLSADFRRHPVGFILPRVIELHDRRRVTVFGYSTGLDDGSPIRRRLAAAFDHFVDVSSCDAYALSQRIRRDEIDILVDLNGWTADGCPEVLAMRSAPIQVSWLGYAGTLGRRDLADYLIGDPVATPIDSADDFSETLALLPGCYLPVDDSRDALLTPTREQEGLPENAFVFCSHNGAYKFNPSVFNLWCSILSDAPDSVLWLSQPAGDGASRLRKEAEKRGISSDRIVFAKRVEDRSEHLGRLSLADLALDPFPYNSHSTGVDMLWAGVPMVALLGNTFPSRVGASLLESAALADLVVKSPEQYVALAVSLYNDRRRLASLRARIRPEVRDHLPLFRMTKFVGELEGLYEEMWNNAVSGNRRLIDGRKLNRGGLNDDLA